MSGNFFSGAEQESDVSTYSIEDIVNRTTLLDINSLSRPAIFADCAIRHLTRIGIVGLTAEYYWRLHTWQLLPFFRN